MKKHFLHLDRPNPSHKSEYNAMIAEWRAFEDITHTSPWALFQGQNFEEFLAYSDSEPVIQIENMVQATLFFLVDMNQRILWALQIRHNLGNQNLREWGGHIGYGVRPSERRKWYATDMLHLGIIEAKKLWLDRVMLGCDIWNTASAKVIEKNGGILERIAHHDGKESKIYWIEL